MNKTIKQIVEKAKHYQEGNRLDGIYIISSNRLYDGFWGKNGYNHIIVIGYSRSEDEYYLVNKCDTDVLEICVKGRMDIPHDKNCIHYWFDEPVCFKNTILSSIALTKFEEKL